MAPIVWALAGAAGFLLARRLFGRSARVWPVSTNRGVISGYGVSRDGGARVHAGADVGAFPGDRILAIDDGTVLHMVSGFGIGAGLQAVAVRHPDADYIYAEIRVEVKPGDTVSAGQRIGRADKNGDGNSMLHLEAWEHGRVPKGFTPWYGGKAPPVGLLNIGAILNDIRGAK